MTLNQIVYFVKTAECQHMINAARALMISQPSLSMSLAKLEEELGVQLFERRGRGIVLTPEGSYFLPYAEKILKDYDVAINEMERLRQNSESSLTIAYVNPLSEHFLPRLFHEFQAEHQFEGTCLRSIEMLTPEIIEAFDANSIDLALCSRIPKRDELIQIPILREPLVLIVPKGHPLEQEYLRTGEPATVESVCKAPLVTYFKASPMYATVMQYFADQDAEPNVCHSAGNETAIANLVAEQMGVAVLARTETLPWNDIAEIPLENLSQSRNIYLTYRAGRKSFKLARTMIGFIRQKYGLE